MTKEFNESYNIVYLYCHKATLHLEYDIISENITDGIILFKVGWSWLSFGETFKVVITKIGSNRTKVEIGSESSFKLTLIDWGKNDKNVNDFFEKLSNLLKNETVSNM